MNTDVMLTYSVDDPRAAQVFDSYRLDDTKVMYQGRKRGARVGTSVCPDLSVNSNGAVMIEHWLIPTRTAAAMYGIRTLNHAAVLNEGRRASDAYMRTLGRYSRFALDVVREPDCTGFSHQTLHDRATDAALRESYTATFCQEAIDLGPVEAIGFRDQHRTICL